MQDPELIELFVKPLNEPPTRTAAALCVAEQRKITLASFGRFLLSGGRSHSSVMTTWERKHFAPGGGNAMIWYVVYGSFPKDISISGSHYRTAGIPKGVELRRFTRAEHGPLPFTDSSFAIRLQKSDPAMLAHIEQCPECLVLQGEVDDPADLDYLRDSIGVVTFFMDHGGVGVADVQQARFFNASDWRDEFFEAEKPVLHRHVFIMYSADESGPGAWFHTRGLRKFGRPDLSLRNVPDEYKKAAVVLCNRFIEFLAEGGRIAESQEIRMEALPSGLICHHKGSYDDLDFNNVHVEIRF
jgi:hypothetical protein